MTLRKVVLVGILTLSQGCWGSGPVGPGKTLTRVTVRASVEGEDLKITEQEVLDLIHARFQAEGIETTTEIPGWPFDETTTPIIHLWVRTGPQVCREFYRSDTGTCDRLGVEFREAVRLVRLPEFIVLAPTIQFSEGSDYRLSPEVYRAEIQTERLQERLSGMLDWLIDEGLWPDKMKAAKAQPSIW